MHDGLPAIEAESVSKRYRLGSGSASYGRLTESLSSSFRRLRRVGTAATKDDVLWALRDVSLTINPGEVVGLVGRNGAGKSTLLKVLSRITQPSGGSVTLRGRVGSLLEVGTGFHPELSGRENIYLNGAILGMRRREIQRRFDEIVDFAQIDRFLETPVKRYSSGMYVRLAFAVAAHLETEILLVDEVLAVGDAGFQKKSLGKMGDISSQGRTVVLVSHNMAAIESLCTRAYLLAGGALAAEGTPSDVIGQYVRLTSTVATQELDNRADRKGDGRLRLTSVTTTTDRGPGPLQCGEPGELRIQYAGSGALRNIHISAAIYDAFGRSVALLGNEMPGHWFDEIASTGSFVCRFGKVGILPGSYTVTLFVTVNGEIADWIQDAAEFDVSEGDFYGSGKLPPASYGPIAIEYAWTTEAFRSAAELGLQP